jgi:hypothetical protein
MRFREAQKHTNPTDPDPEHWVNNHKEVKKTEEIKPDPEPDLYL